MGSPFTDESEALYGWLRLVLLYWLKGQDNNLRKKILMEDSSVGATAPNNEFKTKFLALADAVSRGEQNPPVTKGEVILELDRKDCRKILGADIGALDLTNFQIPRPEDPIKPEVMPTQGGLPYTFSGSSGDNSHNHPTKIGTKFVSPFASSGGSILDNSQNHPTESARRALTASLSTFSPTFLPSPAVNHFAKMAENVKDAKETDYEANGDPRYMMFKIKSKTEKISDHKHAFLLVSLYHSINTLSNQLRQLQAQLEQLEQHVATNAASSTPPRKKPAVPRPSGSP